MFKQSSHRNQRTKGFKVKHVVQLCLLIGVCFWLLYQVRHSRGKNTSDQENRKVSDKVKGGKEILNLGRKHLHPRASGDIEHHLNYDNMSEDTAGKETSKTVDGAREGTKQEEMKVKDKGDAGDMENDDRDRGREDNENEKGKKKKNRDQENGGDKENVRENKDQEIPEENESKEVTEEKHVDENNSQELQEKGTEENEAAQEGKSTEQSSGSTEEKEKDGLSKLMEERSTKSKVEFDGTTDKSNDVEKEDRATEKAHGIHPTKQKSNNSTIASFGNQNNTSGSK